MDDTNKEDKKCEREQVAYLALMKLHNTNRIDYNDRKWGTIQFFQTLITALLVLAATLALYSFKDGDYSWYVIFITILLLVAAMIAAWYAPKNLARESKLVFKEEYQCYKYGNLLNLNHTIPVKNRLLEGDEFLFSDKWRLCDHDLCEPKSSKCPNGVTSYEEWLECRMDGYYFKSIFETLFWAEFFIAIAIAIVIVAAGILNGFSHTPKQIGIGQQQPAIQDLPYQNHYYFPR